MLQRGWWAPWGEPGPSAGGAAGGSTHRRWEPRWGSPAPSQAMAQGTGQWPGGRAEPHAAAGPCRPLGSPSQPGTRQGTGCGVTPPALTHLHSAQAAPFLPRHLPGRPAHVVVLRFSPKLRDWHQTLPPDQLWAPKLPALLPAAPLISLLLQLSDFLPERRKTLKALSAFNSRDPRCQSNPKADARSDNRQQSGLLWRAGARGCKRIYAAKLHQQGKRRRGGGGRTKTITTKQNKKKPQPQTATT